MKKTSIKKSKLSIRQNSLLKEGWADAAASSATSGEWLKIATTALKGAQEALKRSWDTVFVLPWKLYFALKNGESLEEVMKDWEAKDKIHKANQQNIISQTGVESTVNAFVGVCSPGILLGQAWCDYTDTDGMAERWKNGSADVWNKTIARNNPDLQIKLSVDSKKFNAQLVYSNFIKTITTLLGIKNDEVKYGDYKDFEASKKTWTQFISVANSFSTRNQEVKDFFGYLTHLKNVKDVTYKSASYAAFLKDNSIGEAKILAIEKELFSNVAKNKVTAADAGIVIIANDFPKELDIISKFIENATNIKASFKSYKASKPSSHTGTQSDAKTTTDGVNESIKLKSLSIKNTHLFRQETFNRQILEENQSSDNFESFTTKYFQNFGDFLIAQCRFIDGARSMIIYEISLLMSKNMFYVYNDVLEKLKAKDNITNLSNDDTTLSRKSKLLNMLERIELFIENIKKQNENISLKPIQKELLDSFNEEDKTVSIAINEFKKSLEDQNKDLMNNNTIMIVLNDLAMNNLKQGEEEPSREQIDEEIERIQLLIGNEDRLKMAYELVTGTTFQFWKESLDNGTLSDLKSFIVSTKKKLIDVQSLSNEVLTKNLLDALAHPGILNCYDNPKISDILEYYNTTLDGDFTSDLDRMIQQPYDGLIAETTEDVKQLLLAKSTSTSEASEEDKEDEVAEKGEYTDISGDLSVTIAKTRDK